MGGAVPRGFLEEAEFGSGGGEKRERSEQNTGDQDTKRGTCECSEMDGRNQRDEIQHPAQA